MENKNHIKEKLSKSPYRGIITEVAKEEGVTRNAIWNALYIHENLRITELVAQKVSQRRQRYNNAKKEFASC